MKKKVSFFCVGAQKAGTSTLHDILQQHPGVNLPKRKETHYFRDDDKFSEGLGYYFNLFEKKQQAKAFGEIDPEYLYFPDCAQRMYDTFGTTKITAILRNPVDRAYSHYLMTQSRGLEDLSFEEAVSTEKERLQTHFDHINFSYIRRGMYTSQIERFEKVFGADHVRVYLFDDLIQDPQSVVDPMVLFVGLDPFKFDYAVKSNVASEPKSEKLRDFVYKPNKFKKMVGKLIPSKQLKNDIMTAIVSRNKKEAEKTQLSQEMKRQLYREFFVEEIARLEGKLNRDLSHWKYE
ncbi:MAG: sulfotransferase [Bacteroidota bacterium]